MVEWRFESVPRGRGNDGRIIADERERGDGTKRTERGMCEWKRATWPQDAGVNSVRRIEDLDYDRLDGEACLRFKNFPKNFVKSRVQR